MQRNPHLDSLTFDRVAQVIINRLAMLQLCDDRNIESNHPFLQLSQQDEIYQQLCQLWTNDSYYAALVCPLGNDRALTDQLLGLMVGDSALRSIIQSLDAIQRGSETPGLPIEWLGHLYEQFLSKDNASTRKTGGIYYTPTHLVDYVVNHTVGKLLGDKTLTNLPPLRILDPACGCGSFLLGAYQYLLNWYRIQYSSEIDRHKDCLYLDRYGNWQLTTEAKQQILLSHIHGVDIDPEAVEITRRSLLLKMLEGISEEQQLRQQKLLPSFPKFSLSILDNNIQCGNALVSSDIYQTGTQFTPTEIAEINAFDWEYRFSLIMQSGGFDIVVSNPPWVFTRNVSFGDRIKRYYYSKYLAHVESTQWGRTKQTGKVNLFVVFLFQLIKLTHQQGILGMIVPNTLLRSTVYDVARKYILDQCSIEKIVDLGCDAFTGVTASSIILILGKDLTHTQVKFCRGIDQFFPPEILDKSTFLQNTSYVFSVLINEEQKHLFQKIEALSIPLGTLTQEIIEGIVCKREQISDRFLDDRYRRLLEGKDIYPYCIRFREKYILFDRHLLHRPRPDYVWAAKEKIILRRIGGSQFPLIAALDTERYYAFASTNSILLQENCPYDIRYILALLNSRLLNYYYAQKFTNQSSLTVNISKTFVAQLPIRAIHPGCSIDHAIHDHLVGYVNKMHQLSQQLAIPKSPTPQPWLQQQIETTDQQIDRAVYELYKLSEAQIEMVENRYQN